jgi:DNA replicative helicase MCM subunit Mcm2 (Cdc46/Mcm family)
LLQCVGAVPRIDRLSKHRIRGDIHLLFAGDPGVGKSEFGFFIEKILPMSIRTIGGKSTTTKAALTTSSDLINGVRIVTFGVLPRCDLRGTAIVDELDKRDTDDMQILSVPMDDNQVIPTHKSGFHHNVFARCPVLLLGNATKKHGKWDITKTIDDQTNYARWLISRVDLVFVMVDEGDMQEKEQMVRHMAKTRGNMVSEMEYDKNYKNKLYSDISIEKIENDLSNNRFDGVYDTEYLRHEIHYLKQNYAPTIKPGSGAEALLRKEYLRFSQLTVLNDFGDGDGPVSQAVMDARAYNGLERIAMAVARCRRHHTVTEQDMDKALGLMLSSLTSMMPRPKKDSENLNDANVYKQMTRILTSKDGIKKVLDATNAGWEKKRDEIISRYRNKLHRFNQVLFKRGFYNCKDCHGNGVVTAETGAGIQSETCMTCKGNKMFNRKFTYLDFEADIINSKIMLQKEVKTWFNIYRTNNIVKNAGGSTYQVGFSTIDSVAISDFVDQLAIATANEDIRKEKERMDGGVDGIGPTIIPPGGL